MIKFQKQSLVESPFFRDILYGRERNHLKSSSRLLVFFYLHVILFRIHEREVAISKKLDTDDSRGCRNSEIQAKY